jgi:ankyrin repeat protein
LLSKATKDKNLKNFFKNYKFIRAMTKNLSLEQEKEATDINDNLLLLAYETEADNIEKIRELLSSEEVDTSSKNMALLFAAENGDTKLVELLLDKGAEVNYQKPAFIEEEEDLKPFEYGKIDFGQNPKPESENNGITPLICASGNGHESATGLLLKRGADINLASEYGRTALIESSKGGHEKVVKKLLDWGGAEIRDENKRGETALTLAAKNGHKPVVELLLKCAQRKVREIINGKDALGNTPLHYASQNGYEEIVELLLEKEVNLTLRNNNNKTAQNLAEDNNYQNIIDLIKEKIERPPVTNPAGPQAQRFVGETDLSCCVTS